MGTFFLRSRSEDGGRLVGRSSAGLPPADHYEVVFSTDKASIRRRDGDIETLMEVTVSSEHLAELRRMTLTNLGNQPRELELTSYLEPVLLAHASDLAHPAFESSSSRPSIWPDLTPCSVVAGRDLASERPAWGVHVMAVDQLGPRLHPQGRPAIRDRPSTVRGSRTIRGRSGRAGCETTRSPAPLVRCSTPY